MDVPEGINTSEKLAEYYLNCPYKSSDIDLFLWGEANSMDQVSEPFLTISHKNRLNIFTKLLLKTYI
jgi:hypothetical protein